MSLRFAPSPTGNLHIGGLRTLLFNYIISQQIGCPLYLRIDDTDTGRCKIEYEKDIKKNVLDVFNFPISSIFNQSSQHDTYRDFFDKKFREYCYKTNETPEELEKKRANKPGFRYLREENLSNVVKLNEPGVYRIDSKKVMETFSLDKIFQKFEITRDITLDWSKLDDVIIMKSDLTPTYFFASAIDDVTHRTSIIVRGEEWLGTIEKYLMVYFLSSREEKLNLARFIHLPLILNPDKTKMSKRNNQVIGGVTELLQLGYSPMVLLNYCYKLLFGTEVANPKSLYDFIDDYNHKLSQSDDFLLKLKPVCFDQSILNGLQLSFFEKNEKKSLSNLVVIKYKLQDVFDFGKEVRKNVESLVDSVVDKDVITSVKFIQTLRDSANSVLESIKDVYFEEKEKELIHNFILSRKIQISFHDFIADAEKSGWTPRETLGVLRKFLCNNKKTIKLSSFADYIKDDIMDKKLKEVCGTSGNLEKVAA